MNTRNKSVAYIVRAGFYVNLYGSIQYNMQWTSDLSRPDNCFVPYSYGELILINNFHAN